MQMLERATPGYRRGYLECRAGKSKALKDDGTFLGHDYSEGWDACWNDDYWRAFYENEARNKATETHYPEGGTNGAPMPGYLR